RSLWASISSDSRMCSTLAWALESFSTSTSAFVAFTAMVAPSLRRRRAQQTLRCGPRFRRDLRARQHAGDFLAAVVGGECVDAGGDALALVERVLGNQEMLVGARGDLRRMRYRHHLDLAGQPRKPRADRVRYPAAN